MGKSFKEYSIIKEESINNIPKTDLNSQIIQKKEKMSETLNLGQKIEISLGRSIERNTGLVQNIQVYLDGNLIIDSDKNNKGNFNENSGHMYLIINRKNEKIRISTNNKNDERYIKKNQAYVGSVNLPKKYQNKGLGSRIYQSVANFLKIEIVKGDTVSGMSQSFWEKHNSFKPKINNIT